MAEPRLPSTHTHTHTRVCCSHMCRLTCVWPLLSPPSHKLTNAASHPPPPFWVSGCVRALVCTHAYTIVRVCSADLEIRCRGATDHISGCLSCGSAWKFFDISSEDFHLIMRPKQIQSNTRETRSHLLNKTFSCTDYHQLSVLTGSPFVLTRAKSSMGVNEDAPATSPVSGSGFFYEPGSLKICFSRASSHLQRVFLWNVSRVLFYGWWRDHFFSTLMS